MSSSRHRRGNSVIETLFGGQPHEMTTVYYKDGRHIALTHFCAAGNQPRMRATTTDGRSLVFEFDGGSNLDPAEGRSHHGGPASISSVRSREGAMDRLGRRQAVVAFTDVQPRPQKSLIVPRSSLMRLVQSLAVAQPPGPENRRGGRVHVVASRGSGAHFAAPRATP